MIHGLSLESLYRLDIFVINPASNAPNLRQILTF